VGRSRRRLVDRHDGELLVRSGRSRALAASICEPASLAGAFAAFRAGPAQFADHRDHVGRELIRRGVGPSRAVYQTSQPGSLIADDPGVHRLARRTELPRHLGLRYALKDLQNGAISVLGHPIAGTTRNFISHKIKIKPDPSTKS
jgi:hypothetical protein